MRSIDEYLDAAKMNAGMKSDRELSRAMGFKGNAVSHWRTKRSWPTDEHFVQIAKMAKTPPTTALLELAKWKAETAEVRSIYDRMLKVVTAAAASIIVCVAVLAISGMQNSAVAHGYSAAAQGTTGWSALYIMRHWYRGWRRAIERIKRILMSAVPAPA